MNDIDLVIAQFREWAQRQGLQFDADEPKVAILDRSPSAGRFRCPCP